jgi:hypothetical protein
VCSGLQAIRACSRSVAPRRHEGQLLLNVMRACASLLSVHGGGIAERVHSSPDSAFHGAYAAVVTAVQQALTSMDGFESAWAGGVRAQALFKDENIFVSPVSCFSDDAEGELVCLEGHNLAAYLEGEYRRQYGGSISKGKRRQTLQTLLQVWSP